MSGSFLGSYIIMIFSQIAGLASFVLFVILAVLGIKCMLKYLRDDK